MARKILLADDSVTAQNMGRKILADAGYDVATVNNGSAALKRIVEFKPDLIVLDVYMPGYSGLEVCQRLKDSDDTAHIPVLLTVGKLEPFKPEEARRVRADAHIVKPFEASELLTAITRLEDRMVPQPSDGSRFAARGGDRFSGEGIGKRTEEKSDTSWKSRLGFPSKKKKEEPEPDNDDAALGATFRDFRKGKTKPVKGGAKAARKEPEVVPDIPRDITPEELDALSAVAAKLDGPTPAAVDTIAPVAQSSKPVSVEPPAEEVAKTATIVAHTESVKTEEVSAVLEAKADVPAETVPAEANTELQPASEIKHEAEAAVASESSVTESTIDEPKIAESKVAESKIEEKATAEAPAFAVEVQASAGQENCAVEIPVAHTELPTESALAAADHSVGEVHSEVPPNGNSHSEVPSSDVSAPQAQIAMVTVNAASFTQEAAPVEPTDEPLFAAAASALDQPAQEQKASAQEENNAKPAEAIAHSETVEAIAPVLARNVESLEFKPEAAQLLQSGDHQTSEQEPKTHELKVEAAPATEKTAVETSETIAEEIAEKTTVALADDPKPEQMTPVATSLPQPVDPDAPAPTDEELAEALRLLTPSSGHFETSSFPSPGTLAAAGQWLAEEAARTATASPRWVAEPVALSPEEAAVSLEEEMFRTFASVPAETELSSITGVSAIVAAVDNRLDASELSASGKPLAVQVAEQVPNGFGSSEHGSAGHDSIPHAETTSAVSAAEAPLEMTPMSPAVTSAADGTEVTQDRKIVEDTLPPEKLEEPPAEEVEEVAPATFADAVSKDEGDIAVETKADTKEESVKEESDNEAASAAKAATAAEQNDSSSDAGGQESMGKEAKSKSEKSKWHQLRTAGAAATSDAVEEAKRTEPAPEEAPKAMAAAAAEGSPSAPDAGTIASIVDSVMADLRPKIVEEIAKKLAGK